MAFPKLDSGLPTGTTGIDGTLGIGGPSGSSSDLDLGQAVGNMGAMNILSSDRAVKTRCNAVELLSNLQHSRDRSAKNVIASLSSTPDA